MIFRLRNCQPQAKFRFTIQLQPIVISLADRDRFDMSDSCHYHFLPLAVASDGAAAA
jgi:hypothetical protein